MKWNDNRLRGHVSQLCNPGLRVSQAEFDRGLMADPKFYREIRPVSPLVKRARKALTWTWRSLEGTN